MSRPAGYLYVGYLGCWSTGKLTGESIGFIRLGVNYRNLRLLVANTVNSNVRKNSGAGLVEYEPGRAAIIFEMAALTSLTLFTVFLACAVGFSPSPIFFSNSIKNFHTRAGLETAVNIPKLRSAISRSSALSSISMQAKSPILSSIDKVVKENKIIVFMKGTKDFPQCGFSNTVVQVVTSFPISDP